MESRLAVLFFNPARSPSANSRRDACCAQRVKEPDACCAHTLPSSLSTADPAPSLQCYAPSLPRLRLEYAVSNARKLQLKSEIEPYALSLTSPLSIHSVALKFKLKIRD